MDNNSDLPLDKPRTLVLPPLPYAAAIAGGWWLDRYVVPLSLNFGPASQPLAVLFVAGGLGLMLWSVWLFFLHKTTVNPYSAASRLCVSGPFRFSRNPIYLGDWLILLGCSLWFATFWPLVFAPMVWAMVRYGVIRHEEEHLAARFGQEYQDYKNQVRRWI